MTHKEIPIKEHGVGKTRAALKLVFIYALFAGLWILFSDKAVAWFVADPATIILVSIVKGWLFVAVTSLLLLVLIRRLLDQVLTESRNALEAQAEKASARNLLDNIVNSSPDAIYAKDLEGRYLLINREAARATGKTVEQVLGRDDAVLFPLEQADGIRANDLHVIQNNRTSSYEVTLTTLDGDRTYLATKGPLRDGSGQVIGMFGISRDITERKEKEEALRKSEEKFSKAFQASSAAITIASVDDGRYIDVNDAFLEISGYKKEEVIGHTSTELNVWVNPGDRQKYIDTLSRQGSLRNYELSSRMKSGEIRHFLTSTEFIELQEKTCTLNVILDITEQKIKEETLRKSEEKFSKAFLASSASISIASMKDGRYVDVNDAFLQVTGFQKSEVIGYTSIELGIWLTTAEKNRYVEELTRNGSLKNFETRFRMKNGEVRNFLVSTELIDLHGEPCRLNFILDITERKQAEEAIRNLAYFDTLTKLPNRRLLLDRLGHALVASNRSMEFGALMILDLDNFKVLNDTKGHDVGDQLLVEVAHRIVDSVRIEDTVSRLGDDEYVVMLEGLGPDETNAASQTETIAGKIRNALSEPYTLAGGEQVYYSTSSIGMVLFRGNELPIDVLLKQADMALYQAKGAGRNTVRFFNPAMQASIESRSHMESALRNGLENDEFRLFYQPQIDQEGKVTGAEALLRWLPPNQPSVPPIQFIPLAEETGLIIPLGQWVLRTACAQLKDWSNNTETRDLQISINVSARQFRQADFVEHVFDALKQTGINPALLRLELTESLVLENVEDVITRMDQIKAFGVTFSLDDFGTGFSSLSYLKRLPLDEVKIDQSFVRDITTDPSDAAIVRAIIAMSRSLSIHVIAEGVETEAQLQFLKENGCSHFQGYLFSKPVPITDWHQTRFDLV